MLIGIGETKPAKPKTASRLNRLLPTILPTAMSRSPLIAAISEVASSGREVPTATMVKPITSSDIPKAFARLTEPLTNKVEPPTSITRPTIIKARCFNVVNLPLLPSRYSSSTSTASPRCFARILLTTR